MSLLDTLAASGIRPSARKGKTADRPVLRGMAPAVVRWQRAKEDFDDAESRLDDARDAILPGATKFWFDENAGVRVPADSILVEGEDDGGGVLVSFQARWAGTGGLDLIPPALKQERVEIKVDSNKLPEAVAGKFIAGLLALAAEIGCQGAVDVKAGLVPTPDFNARRHLEMTVADNQLAEQMGLGTRISLRAK